MLFRSGTSERDKREILPLVNICAPLLRGSLVRHAVGGYLLPVGLCLLSVLGVFVVFLLWRSPQVGRSPPNIFQSVHGLHQDPAGGALFLQLRGNAPSMPNICGFSVHLLRSVSVRRCGECVGSFPLVSDYMRTPLLALGASVNILKIIRLTLSGWGAADGRAGRKETGEARTADRGGRAEFGEKETAGAGEHKKSR